MRKFLIAAVIASALAITSVVVAGQQTVQNYFSPAAAGGDNVLTISGTSTVSGTTTVTTAGEIDVNGTLTIDAAATVTGLVTAPSNATYVIARGTVTLDGTNPSSATTGLAAIVSCTVTNKRSVAPGLDPSAFTIATAAVAGRLDIYAWKVTGAGDTTLIASTDSDDTIDWVCVGT